VAQIALDGARIDAVVGQFVAAAMPQHMWVNFHSAASAARSTMAWKPRFEKGVPRSLTNTKGDLDPCSRCSRRRSEPHCARKHSAATPIMVNSRGGMVAGITRRATVGTAGGGMWADSGISIPNRSKVRPTTSPTWKLQMTRRQRHRHPRKNPTMLSIISPGDLTGTRYQTLEECLQAREQAGNVGECIAY
jgi:hypothetical protein